MQNLKIDADKILKLFFKGKLLQDENNVADLSKDLLTKRIYK
jgi:hypothetical protein